jgi:hypothetical protein
MARSLTTQEWRSIAEQANTEQDPAELTSLVSRSSQKGGHARRLTKRTR